MFGHNAQHRQSTRQATFQAKLPMRLSRDAAKANDFNKVRWEKPNALGKNALGKNTTGKSNIGKSNKEKIDKLAFIKPTLASQPDSIAKALRPLAQKTLAHALSLRLCCARSDTAKSNPNSLLPSSANF